MTRLWPLGVVLLLCTFAVAPASTQQRQSGTPNRGSRIPDPGPRIPSPGFTVVETSIDEMRRAMEQGRTTSRDIVTQSLVRIATYEDRLNAAITINPRARADRSRRA